MKSFCLVFLRLNYFILILIAALVVSCDPKTKIDDEEGIKDFSIWSSAQSDGPVKSYASMLGHTDNLVMGFQRLTGKEYFVGLQLNSGNVLWRVLVPNEDSVRITDSYTLNNHYVFIADGLRCLNLETGEYIWLNDNFSLLSNSIVGIDDKFYFSAQSTIEPRIGSIYVGDVSSGNAQELTIAPFADSLDLQSNTFEIIAAVRRIDPVFINGTKKLIVQSTYKTIPGSQILGVDFLGVYNLESGEWEWNKQVDEPLVYVRPAYYTNGQIVKNNQTKILSFNADSGDIIWEHSTQGTVSENGFFVSEQRIVYKVSSQITAISSLTGNQIWKVTEPNANTQNSKMLGHNGYLYFSCPSQAAVAIHLATGVINWSIRLPSANSTPLFNLNFKGECAIIDNGDNAWVVFPTQGKIYCYDAIK